ncbi:MAG TPA: hypothetical protein VMD76_14580 [Candidatus Sulfotelmatobacter sp.]|nr:hypothetical protein [Candidatus Sulfotelmatobacter sp.]
MAHEMAEQVPIDLNETNPWHPRLRPGMPGYLQKKSVSAVTALKGMAARPLIVGENVVLQQGNLN